MGLLGTLGTIAGGVGGFLLGGPAGAAVGAGLGDTAGNLVGGSGSSGSPSGGVSSLVNPALAASDVALGNQDYTTANTLRQQALQSAVQPYNEKAPLRNQALSGLENYQLPNLNQAFSAGSSNPFYTPLSAPPSSYNASGNSTGTGAYAGGGSGSGTLGTPGTNNSTITQFPAAIQNKDQALGTLNQGIQQGPINMPTVGESGLQYLQGMDAKLGIKSPYTDTAPPQQNPLGNLATLPFLPNPALAGLKLPALPTGKA